MHSAWFRSTFLKVLKFLQIKEGGYNFWGEPILQKVWIIWSRFLYFNFKSFMDPNSSLSIRFRYILHDLGVLYSEIWSFYQLKMGDIISGGNQFFRKSELFDPLLLYFNFKSFLDPNSSSFIKFQCILHNSGVLYSESWNFFKLKRGPNFLEEPILQKVWIISYPLVYFNFKNFMDLNFASFIRYQCIPHES